MTAIRFTVETTFDLPGRDGILVPGVLLTGVIQSGTTLQTEDTRQPVRVLGVEFPTPASQGTNKVTLRIDRRDAPAIKPGTTLIAPT
jgi:hypothetical protein